jgi:2'-5' RNA ligase
MSQRCGATRAFLAFEVPPDVIDNLARVQEELRTTRADLKMVERENLHFTVRFLGEIQEDTVKEVDRRLQGLELPRFEVRVRGVGAFPDVRRPRVVWAGVAGESEESVNSAARTYLKALEGVGAPDDHPFHAHITLARVRSAVNGAGLASFLASNGGRDLGLCTIGSLKLKSSILSPRGPTYSDLREYPLR